SLSFSLTRHPPPCHAIFPYTTLFRSLVHDEIDRALGLLVARPHVEDDAASLLGEAHPHVKGPLAHAVAVVGESERSFHVRMRLTDRKSTRLNSSHDQTSYAVFCLKKK